MGPSAASGSDTADKLARFAAGAVDYVTKPLNGVVQWQPGEGSKFTFNLPCP